MWKIFVENVDFFTSTKDTVIYKYVVNVDYYRNPTVMGTGVGFRTTLLGYFVRMDAAWGIDGGIVSKKPQWLFSFSRDF